MSPTPLQPGDPGYIAPVEAPATLGTAPLTEEAQQYNIAKEEFRDLYIKWNFLSEEEQDADTVLSSELTRLHTIITNYESSQPGYVAPPAPEPDPSETPAPVVETKSDGTPATPTNSLTSAEAGALHAAGHPVYAPIGEVTLDKYNALLSAYNALKHRVGLDPSLERQLDTQAGLIAPVPPTQHIEKVL